MKKKKWVAQVMKTSSALDIPEGLFTKSAKEIAQGLKRAGKKLKAADKKRLEQAKDELRKVFKKAPDDQGLF